MGWKEGRKEGRTEGRKDGRTEGAFPLAEGGEGAEEAEISIGVRKELRG